MLKQNANALQPLCFIFWKTDSGSETFSAKVSNSELTHLPVRLCEKQVHDYSSISCQNVVILGLKASETSDL